MTKHKALLATIQILIMTIANLSVRRFPPHNAIRSLEQQLATAVEALKGE